MVNKIRNGIVWISTPKCATSTCAKHLEEFCDWKGMKYTERNRHGVMAPKNYVNLGHLFSGDVNWEVVKNDDRAVIGSIRNPMDRFISHYLHHISFGDRFKGYEKNVSKFYLENNGNTTFEEGFGTLNNYMVKYLGVGDDEVWDSELLKKKYDFFFVSEEIPQSLENFKKYTGYNFKNKELKTNITDKPRIYKSKKFKEEFIKNNENDYELYNFILENYGFKK